MNSERNRNRDPYGRDRDRSARDWRQQEQFSDSYYGDQNGEYGRDRGGAQMGDDQGRDSYYREAPRSYEQRDDLRERASYRRGRGGMFGARDSGRMGNREANYGPAYFSDGAGREFGSFNGNDFRNNAYAVDERRDDLDDFGSSGGYRSEPRGYGYRDDQRRSERGFFDKAGDEIASWFGDDDAQRRREMDHRGRGPGSYTRSDERILEDACDRLTDDWAVDASNVQVTVESSEVTLDGTVDSRQAKRRAEDVVHDVSGVKHVQNNLRVQDRSDRLRGYDADTDRSMSNNAAASDATS